MLILDCRLPTRPDARAGTVEYRLVLDADVRLVSVSCQNCHADGTPRPSGPCRTAASAAASISVISSRTTDITYTYTFLSSTLITQDAIGWRGTYLPADCRYLTANMSACTSMCERWMDTLHKEARLFH